MKSNSIFKNLFKDKPVKVAVGVIGTVIVFLGAIFVINPSLFKSILGFSGNEFGIDTYKVVAQELPVYTSIAEFDVAKASGYNNGTERATLANQEIIAVQTINATKGYAEIRFLYLTGSSVGIAGYGYVDASKIELVEKYNPCAYDAEYAANNPELCSVTSMVTVTFVQNNGKPNITTTIEKGSSINSLLPERPTKEGYDFVGWFKDTNLTESLEANALVNANVTLYAKWQVAAAKYTVKFDVNGGTPNVSDQLVVVNNYITKPANPTKTDCTFIGWNYGNEVWNFTSMKVNIDTVSGTEVNLVANYNCANQTKHTVTFNANRGVPSQNPVEVVNGDKIAAPSVTLKGYTLLGWKNGNEMWDFEKDKVTSSITLDAVWTLNEPSITFTNANTGAAYVSESWTNSSVKIAYNQDNLPTAGKVQLLVQTPAGIGTWVDLEKENKEFVFPDDLDSTFNKTALMGGYTLKYRVKDLEPGTGNFIFSNEKRIVLNIDKTAPTVPTQAALECATTGCAVEDAKVNYKDDSWVTTGVVLYEKDTNFGSKDTQSGINLLQISRDNITWETFKYDPYSSTYKMSSANYTGARYIRTVDKAGNVSPVKKYNIKVDKTTASQLTDLIVIAAKKGIKYSNTGDTKAVALDAGGATLSKGADGFFTANASTGLSFFVSAPKSYSSVAKIEMASYDYDANTWGGWSTCNGSTRKTNDFEGISSGAKIAGTTKYKRLVKTRITNGAGVRSAEVKQYFYINQDYHTHIVREYKGSTAKCPF